MRILLDENLPRKLAAHLLGHECQTVLACGWAGKKNGVLLALADPLFDVFLTLDKNLPYQQNLQTKRIAVIIIRARSNRIQDLLPVLPDCLAALANMHPGQLLRNTSAMQLFTRNFWGLADKPTLPNSIMSHFYPHVRLSLCESTLAAKPQLLTS